MSDEPKYLFKVRAERVLALLGCPFEMPNTDKIVRIEIHKWRVDVVFRDSIIPFRISDE